MKGDGGYSASVHAVDGIFSAASRTSISCHGGDNRCTGDASHFPDWVASISGNPWLYDYTSLSNEVLITDPSLQNAYSWARWTHIHIAGAQKVLEQMLGALSVLSEYAHLPEPNCRCTCNTPPAPILCVDPSRCCVVNTASAAVSNIRTKGGLWLQSTTKHIGDIKEVLNSLPSKSPPKETLFDAWMYHASNLTAILASPLVEISCTSAPFVSGVRRFVGCLNPRGCDGATKCYSQMVPSLLLS